MPFTVKLWLLILRILADLKKSIQKYLSPELQCLHKVKEDMSQVSIFQDAKITFQNDHNQNSFIFSEEFNEIFDHKYHIDLCNLYSILYSMLYYQYLT